MTWQGTDDLPTPGHLGRALRRLGYDVSASRKKATWWNPTERDQKEVRRFARDHLRSTGESIQPWIGNPRFVEAVSEACKGAGVWCLGACHKIACCAGCHRDWMREEVFGYLSDGQVAGIENVHQAARDKTIDPKTMAEMEKTIVLYSEGRGRVPPQLMEAMEANHRGIVRRGK